jgi:hypothetical protein
LAPKGINKRIPLLKRLREKMILGKTPRWLPPTDSTNIEEIPPARIVEPMGLIGFIASMLAVILPLTPAIIIPFVSGAVFILLLLGLILCVVSLGRFKRYRDVYWGKGFALAGMAISLLGLIIFALAVILVFLFTAFFASLSC